MRTSLRLLHFARPYSGLFLLGLVATLVASLLDGVTVVILVPLLKTLFGTAGALGNQATALETFADRMLRPVLAGATPGGAVATRLVLLLLFALLVKNALTYVSNQLSVSVQEGLARDLRVGLFRHLLTIDLGFFQRTRAGQLIAGVVVDADQAKQAVSAALAACFQNLVLILTSVLILGSFQPGCDRGDTAARGHHRVPGCRAQNDVPYQVTVAVPSLPCPGPGQRRAGVRAPRPAVSGRRRAGRAARAVRAGDCLRPGQLRLRPRHSGPERRLLPSGQGQGGGDRGALRSGKDHAARPATPF